MEKLSNAVMDIRWNKDTSTVDMSIKDEQGDTVCVLPLTRKNVNWIVQQLLSEVTNDEN